MSAGAAYGWAGESTINGADKNDDKSTALYGGSVGRRISSSQGLRLSYLRTDTLNDLGADMNSFILGWTFRF
jgi:hypothetical protein